MSATPLTVRALAERDREGLRVFLTERWGESEVVSRGRLHDAAALDGLVAEQGGAILGYLTWRPDAAGLEVVTLDALRPRTGAGRALLDAVTEIARARGVRRVWLITTNDNLPAQAFYEAVGFTRVAVHAGAVDASRRLKPSIPRTGLGGVPIRDEIEYARSV